MHRIWMIICLLATTVGCYAQQPDGKTLMSSFKKLHWLSGNWIRSNAAPGEAGKEYWSIKSPTEIRGQGLTLRGADTVFLENLAILSENGQLYYVVDFKGLPKPIYFKFTALTKNGFVCENPDNDFPKKIVYNRKGDRIDAYISTHDKRVDYEFVRENGKAFTNPR